MAATFLVPGNMTEVWWLGLCGTRSLVLLSDSVVASSCSVAVPGCKNFSMEAIYLGTRSLVAKVTVWWLAACQQMFLECLEWTEIQHLSCANGEQIISHPIGLVRPGTRLPNIMMVIFRHEQGYLTPPPRAYMHIMCSTCNHDVHVHISALRTA